MEFAWTLCLLAMCGGTIFHRNIWSFSKCSKKSKSVASDHNFFSFFQIHCMLQLTNLVQVIIECRSCSANAMLWTCARQSAPTVRALPSAYAFQVRVHHPRPPIRVRTSGPSPNSVRALLSVPRDSTRLRALCGSRLKLSVPVPIPACARSYSGWCPARFRGQPPHTANRHVGGQQ
jgi:hypothetical protein